jgi:hypothetical protein
MPVSKYFGGHGEKVMSSMRKQYGEEKGKQVFYATANKKGVGPTAKTAKHLVDASSKRRKK